MFSILIVDDEELIRKGIAAMIDWKALNVTLIGEAENGIEAMEFIRVKKPDILLTDIRMAECDGIELLSSLQREKIDIITIVISGYDEFQYAKEAIKFRSIDYILKPIDPEELNASIQKACNILQSKKYTEDNENPKNKAVEMLHRFINNRDIKDQKEASEIFGFDVFNCLVCASYFKKNEEFSYGKYIYDKLCKEGRFLKTFLLEDKNKEMIIFFEELNISVDLVESNVYKSLRDNIKDLQISGARPIIGIGKTVKGIEHIHESYVYASEAACYCIFNSEEWVYGYKGITRACDYKIPIESYENDVNIAIISGNVAKLDELLLKLTNDIFSKKNVTLESVRYHIRNLCLLLYRYDYSLSTEISSFLTKIDNNEYFLEFISIENIKQAIKGMFHVVLNKRFEQSGGKELIVMRVKEFIENNYTEDIGLDGISKLFHISHSYLSSTFKKETGENICELITRLRMERAKKILASSDVKIPQVSQMVGFADISYFFKVFKKETGMTPKEFRNK